MASRDDLLALYPMMNPDGLEITSPEDESYNCIAWVEGIDNRIAQDSPGGYYWKGTPGRIYVLESLVSHLEACGFVECRSDDLGYDPAFEKIALYEWNQIWKHAARLLPDGRWTSKLGVDGHDISHSTPDCISSRGCAPKGFGNVCKYMKRPTNGKYESVTPTLA